MKRCVICGNPGDEDSTVCSVCGNSLIDIPNPDEENEDDIIELPLPDELLFFGMDQKEPDENSPADEEEQRLKADMEAATQFFAEEEQQDQAAAGNDASVTLTEGTGELQRKNQEAETEKESSASGKEMYTEEEIKQERNRQREEKPHFSVHENRIEQDEKHQPDIQEGVKQETSRQQDIKKTGADQAVNRQAYAQGRAGQPANRGSYQQGGADQVSNRQPYGQGGADQAPNRQPYGQGGADQASNRQAYGQGVTGQASNRQAYGQGGAGQAMNRQVYGQGGAGQAMNRQAYGQGGAGQAMNRQAYGQGGAGQAMNRQAYGQGGAGQPLGRAPYPQGGMRQPGNRAPYPQGAANQMRNRQGSVPGHMRPGQPQGTMVQQRRPIPQGAGMVRQGTYGQRLMSQAKGMFRSPLFVLMALLNTIALGVSVAGILMKELNYSGLLSVLKNFDMPVEALVYVDKFMELLSKAEGESVIELAGKVPDLLLCIGIWILVITALRKKEGMASAGFLTVKIVVILKMIVSCIILVACLIFSVTLVVSAWVSSGRTALIASAVFLGIMIILSMAVIMYFFCLLHGLKVCRKNAVMGEDFGKLPLYAVVLTILIALVSAVGLLSAVINMEIAGIVSFACQIGWMLLLGIWMLVYRNKTGYNE